MSIRKREAKKPIALLGLLVALALLRVLPGIAAGPPVRVSYIQDVREWIQRKTKADFSALHPAIKEVASLQFLDPKTGWMSLYPDRDSDFIRLGLVSYLVRIDAQIEKITLLPRLGVPGRYSIGDISFVSERIGWVLVHQNTDDERINISFLYHTKDGGRTWVRQPGVNFPNPIDKIQFIDSQRGWALDKGHIRAAGSAGAAGPVGYLYITNDGGSNWEEVPVKWGELSWDKFKYSEFRYFLDMQFVNREKGWLSGEGLILHTRDGGRTWEAQYDATHKNPSHIDALFFLNEKEGWACGVDGKRLLHTIDGGRHWQEIRLKVKGMGPFDAFWDIFFLNSRVGVISGQHHEYEELTQEELKKMKEGKSEISPLGYTYTDS